MKHNDTILVEFTATGSITLISASLAPVVSRLTESCMGSADVSAHICFPGYTV
jgi:hypothetical protein